MGGMMLSFISDIMSWLSNLLSGLFETVIDWLIEYIVEPIMCIIPQTLYILYASLGSIGDVFQLIFRKMAGLDVYYVDGQAVTGDIVTNFIAGILGIGSDLNANNTILYSTLSTVFWSFMIFGVVLCVFSTIFTIIKGQYNYDDKEAKGGPTQHIFTMIRTLINMAVVPLVVVLGLYASQAVLTALDRITTTDTTDVASMYGSDAASELISAETSSGDVTYAFYDIFGYYSSSGTFSSWKNENTASGKLATIATTTTSFSGVLFKTAAYNANRLRNGDFTTSTAFTGNTGSDSTLFASASGDADEMANLIDNAFALNLHYNRVVDMSYDLGTSTSYKITMGNIMAGSFYSSDAYVMTAFSKYSVSIVWYYYNLWDFNFLVGFAAVIMMLVVFTNIVLGLMQRVIMLVALFLVMPAAYGITPLDGGEMAKRWRSNFLQYTLGAYGAVLGMNLIFLILPYLNEIQFTNVEIVDLLLQSLFIIVGLMTMKSLISTLSSIVGGNDVNEAGGKISGEIGSAIGKAVSVGVGAVTGGAAIAKGLDKKMAARDEYKQAKKNAKVADDVVEREGKNIADEQQTQNDLGQYKATNAVFDSLDSGTLADLRNNGKTPAAIKKRQAAEKKIREEAMNQGLGNKETDEMLGFLSNSVETSGVGLRSEFAHATFKDGGKKQDNTAYGRALKAMGSKGGGTFTYDDAAVDARIMASENAELQASERQQTALGLVKKRDAAKAKMSEASGEIAGGILRPLTPVLSGIPGIQEGIKASGMKERRDEKKKIADKEKDKAAADAQKKRDATQEEILNLLKEIKNKP